MTLSRFSGALWNGLKVMRIADVINLHLKFCYQIYVNLVLSLVGLIMVCHYAARIQYLMAQYYWNGGTGISDGSEYGKMGENGMCKQIQKEWGANENELLHNTRKLRNESIKISMFFCDFSDIIQYCFQKNITINTAKSL